MSDDSHTPPPVICLDCALYGETCEGCYEHPVCQDCCEAPPTHECQGMKLCDPCGRYPVELAS